MDYQISDNSQYCFVHNGEVPVPPRFEHILLDPKNSSILAHARRRYNPRPSYYTVVQYPEPHIAGFAFEELMFHTFYSITSRTMWDDTGNHDIRVGNNKFEMKCRFSGNYPVEVATERDFEVKVPYYNRDTQNPDYYVFGYCHILRDGCWKFDVLGYQKATVVKQEKYFVDKGCQREKGRIANTPSYLLGISELRPPGELWGVLTNG